MAVAFPPPLVPIAGASDREGRSRRNRHHWIAPSRGIIPIYLILIIAAPPGLQRRAFSGSIQYGNATRLQTDDGSDRGHARGLFRRAKVPVGSGDRRRRASSARGLSPMSFFGVLGLTMARRSFLARQQGRLRGGGKSGRGHFSAVRATPRPPFLTHARALATHSCGVDEAMVGDENIPVQEAEGGGDAMGGTKQMAEGGSSSLIGGIVKKKCKRSRRPNGRQQQEMAMIGRRLAAVDVNVN